MKKLFTPLYYFNLLIIGILLTANSCTKDSPSLKQNSQDLLEETKSYFKENYSELVPQQDLGIVNSDNLFKKLGKKVLWQYALKIKISLGEAIKVPVYYNIQTFTRKGKAQRAIDLYNISYLMMYKDKNHKMHTEWVITIPDDDNADKNPLLNKKFSGIIYVLDWKGSLIKAYKITPDGHQYISKDLSFTKGIKQIADYDTKKLDYAVQQCSSTSFTQPCSDGCTGGYELVFVESCYWIIISGGGSGDGGGNIPSDPGTGGGGSTNSNDYPPSLTNRDVINNLNNSDADCIFNHLKNNVTFQNLIADFQNNKNLNVTFQMGNIPFNKGQPVAGTTHHHPGTNNFTITIDNSIFNQVNAIEATNTFIHEAFHANLWIQAQLWFPDDLPINFQI